MVFIGFFVNASLAYMNNKVLPLWYPVLPRSILESNKLHRVDFCGVPYVCYKGKESYVIHSDKCPHQGASLSKGWVSAEGNIQCPYHGFEFCSGMFCKIPDPKKNVSYFTSRSILPSFRTAILDDTLFVNINQSANPDEIFFPPEEYDARFEGVSGYRVIDKEAHLVVENLLDMLHISYVHSFGSRKTPLPFKIMYRDINSTSGRTVFKYNANQNTISNKVGGDTSVIVENEFHLPCNTITRVNVNNLVKTVFTRTIPIGENKSILLWKIYRNFWIDPNYKIFTSIGDGIIRYLMEKTIDEDVEILQHVYTDFEHTIDTKYDVTIREFRKKFENFASGS